MKPYILRKHGQTKWVIETSTDCWQLVYYRPAKDKEGTTRLDKDGNPELFGETLGYYGKLTGRGQLLDTYLVKYARRVNKTLPECIKDVLEDLDRMLAEMKETIHGA